ncbi:MAG: tetratricopeptide repeat protein, partial [Chloroflexota bacterium]
VRKATVESFPNAQPYINYATLLIEYKKQHEKALTILNQAKKVDSQNPDVYLLNSQIVGQSGQFNEAIKILKDGLHYLPDHPRLTNHLAWYYTKAHQFEQAHKYLNMAKKSLNDVFDVQLTEAVWHHEQQQYDIALPILEKLYEEQPKHSNILAYLASIYANIGQSERSIEISKEFINLYPDDAEVYNTRGYAHYMLAQYKEAIRDFDKCLELVPNHQLAQMNRLTAYINNSSDSQLIEIMLKELLEMYPENAIYIKTNLLSMMGRIEEAINLITERLEDEPDNIRLLTASAWYKPLMGIYEDALADINKAIALADNNALAGFYDTRGYIYWLLDKYQQAKEDYQRAIELAIPYEKPIYKIGLAMTFFKRNEADKAIALWNDNISLHRLLISSKHMQREFIFAPPFYEAMRELEALANAEASTDN